MRKFFGEYRSILFALLIILIVNIIALISFRKINQVSSTIAETIKIEVPTSFISKQLILELQTAENDVSSYYLTQDLLYRKNFYSTLNKVKLQIEQLNTKKSMHREDGQLVDSLISYCKEWIIALNTKVKIKYPDRVVDDLDRLSEEIDLLYQQDKSDNKRSNRSIDRDKSKDKKGFINRVFTKKKNDTLNDNSSSSTQSDEEVDLKGKLQEKVSNIKSSQERIIKNDKQTSLELENTIYHSKERMNNLTASLTSLEDKRELKKSQNAYSGLSSMKWFTLISTALLSLLLIVLIYLIAAFIKRKVQYSRMLVSARIEAENLALSKERFLSNMSHEIKTPLNAIHGFSELLIKSPKDAEQKKQIEIIRNSAAYMNRLVSNILSNARLNSGKVRLNPTTVNVRSELNEINEILEPQAIKKGIKLIFNLNACKVDYILIDADKFRQIMYNLVGNAIKFTEKGSVTCTVSTIRKDGEKVLQFQIRDTGIGIGKESLDNLFQEFEQGGEKTQSKFGGSGLGLVITKKLVNQLGGQINMKSQLNEGTIVSFHFPYQQSSSNSLEDEQNIHESLEYLDKKTILIVDDEAYNRLLLRSILANYGSIILEANNGIEAVRMVESEKLDLIIMDVRMPEMNGIDATIAIRKKNYSVPILGATAVMDEQRVARCVNAGMDDIIFKPFAKKELVAKLDSIFGCESIEGITSENKQNREISASTIDLGGLDEVTDGDENFKQELIQMFHKSLNSTVEKINKLLTEENYVLIGDQAHKIIPSCKHFEAVQLLSALKHLESTKIVSENDQVDYISQIKIMNQEVVKINAILEPLLTSY